MKKNILSFLALVSLSSILSAAPLEHVKSGDLISAAKYNELVEKVNLLAQSIPKVTPWTNAGPVSISSTGAAPGKGGVVEDYVEYRQVGDEVEYHYKLIQSSAGYAGTGVYIYNLPAGTSFASSVPKAAVFYQLDPLSSPQYYSYTTVRNVIKANGFMSIWNGVSGAIHGQILVVPINNTQFQVIVLWSDGYAYMTNSVHLNMGGQYLSFNFYFSAKSDVALNKDL